LRDSSRQLAKEPLKSLSKTPFRKRFKGIDLLFVFFLGHFISMDAVLTHTARGGHISSHLSNELKRNAVLRNRMLVLAIRDGSVLALRTARELIRRFGNDAEARAALPVVSFVHSLKLITIRFLCSLLLLSDNSPGRQLCAPSFVFSPINR
jgi:hypothetical protein